MAKTPDTLILEAVIDSIDASSTNRLERVRVANALAQRFANEVVGKYVHNARACDNYSWADIAAVLGVTRQAAHERFANWPAAANSPPR